MKNTPMPSKALWRLQRLEPHNLLTYFLFKEKRTANDLASITMREAAGLSWTHGITMPLPVMIAAAKYGAAFGTWLQTKYRTR